MTIKEKGITPNGIDIQIEDWSINYPNMHKPFDTIGCYPIAIEDGEGEYGPRKGEIFRGSFQFDSETMASLVFDNLVKGTITFEDIKRNWSGYFKDKNCLYKDKNCLYKED